MRESTVDGDRAECRRRWWYRGKDGRPCLPNAVGAEEDLERLAHFEYRGTDTLWEPVDTMIPYGRILELMVDVMGNEEANRLGITFGDALDRICERLKVPRREMPQEIETVLLTTTFKIIASGKIPGAAEAG